MDLSAFAAFYLVVLSFLVIVLPPYWSQYGFRDLSGYKFVMNRKRIVVCVTGVLMMISAGCALFLEHSPYSVTNSLLIVLLAVFGPVLFLVSLAHYPGDKTKDTIIDKMK